MRRISVTRASVGVSGAVLMLTLAMSGAWRSAAAGAGAAAIDNPAPVVLASGALQRCLGITAGADSMSRAAADPAACQRLPGADLYDQAGARYQAQDVPGAARLLQTAAQAGNPRAQLRLAIMYEAGQGVPRDPRQAAQWYARAAAAGEPASQRELGGYYEDGDGGLPENWDYAAQLYRASAVQGWQKGQFAFGRAYEFGIGVPQNRQQAIAWFEKAAAQGHAQAGYFARWLRDPSNNIGFRTDAEHDIVIAGKLRFALGSADPTGITFHTSAQRTQWLQKLGAQVNASEAAVRWQAARDQYDRCLRAGGQNCIQPGPRP